MILKQSTTYPLSCTLAQQDAKKTSSAARHLAEKGSHTHLLSTFPPHVRRILEASSEKGSSSWLTALPLTSHGFALHKGDFRDALCLRFGWQSSSLPLMCICSKSFTVEYALSCSCGGYPFIRHNELRDITATLLTEVSNIVGIEPVLQKLSGEHLTQKTSISSDDARLDIVAENFWGHNRQKTYFDVRVFNPFCATLSKVPLPQYYRRAELEKKRAYEQRIREIEFGSLSPIVFSSTGRLGSTATVIFKKLASLIADKQEQPYSKKLFWLHCKVSFSLLRSAIICLCGSRSTNHRPQHLFDTSIDLAISDSKVNLSAV